MSYQNNLICEICKDLAVVYRCFGKIVVCSDCLDKLVYRYLNSDKKLR